MKAKKGDQKWCNRQQQQQQKTRKHTNERTNEIDLSLNVLGGTAYKLT